jgi:NADPH2:quinone reductase
MKAIQLSRHGGPEVLTQVELPLPEPGAREIRVRAQAIGVGKPDALIRRGDYKWMPPMPAVPGNELAGVVDAIGDGVTEFGSGDRVLVSARELPHRGGCYAEAICVPAAAAYRLPDSIDAADAVSLPNYQLALALLYEAGARTPRSILVHGAAGGVATALLQVADSAGILAIGTASSSIKCDFARRAGATHVIDRSCQDVAGQVGAITGALGVDMVLDHVAGPGFTDNLVLLAPLGTLMSYNILGGLPQKNLLEELRRFAGKSLGVRCYTIHTLDSQPHIRRALMLRAIELFACGRRRPPEPTRLALSDAARAHRLLDSGDVLGKIVLIP